MIFIYRIYKHYAYNYLFASQVIYQTSNPISNFEISDTQSNLGQIYIENAVKSFLFSKLSKKQSKMNTNNKIQHQCHSLFLNEPIKCLRKAINVQLSVVNCCSVTAAGKNLTSNLGNLYCQVFYYFSTKFALHSSR